MKPRIAREKREEVFCVPCASGACVLTEKEVGVGVGVGVRKIKEFVIPCPFQSLLLLNLSLAFYSTFFRSGRGRQKGRKNWPFPTLFLLITNHKLRITVHRVGKCRSPSLSGQNTSPVSTSLLSSGDCARSASGAAPPSMQSPWADRYMPLELPCACPP